MHFAANNKVPAQVISACEDALAMLNTRIANRLGVNKCMRDSESHAPVSFVTNNASAAAYLKFGNVIIKFIAQDLAATDFSMMKPLKRALLSVTSQSSMKVTQYIGSVNYEDLAISLSLSIAEYESGYAVVTYDFVIEDL